MCIVSQVRRTIERELGDSMEVLFTDFVNEPLATASVKSHMLLQATLDNSHMLFWFDSEILCFVDSTGSSCYSS